MSADKKSLLTEDPRVPLAAERTFLAWIRTGLALMGFGFVVASSERMVANPSTVSATATTVLSRAFGCGRMPAARSLKYRR